MKNTFQRRILFDLSHPAHINFYKNFIEKLRREDHNILLVALRRGKVPHIIAKEMPDYPLALVGSQGRTRWEIYWRTGILRTLGLGVFLVRQPCDIAFGVVAHQLGLWGKLLGFPVVGVYDDPDHRLNFDLSCRLLTRFYIPACTGREQGNRITFNALKEWAYLSPSYFSPDESALQSLGLQPYSYYFIREVDLRSLNYLAQRKSAITRIREGRLLDGPVVLSLEDKTRSGLYPDWRILMEPVEDIHSLMFFSKAVISNGDSMAREGAMLGRPSVYMGDRTMPANDLLIERGLMRHVTDAAELSTIFGDGNAIYGRQAQETIRGKLAAEWDDINQILYSAFQDLVVRRENQ